MKESIFSFIDSITDRSVTHDDDGEYIWQHYPFIGSGIGSGDLAVFLGAKTCVWISSKKSGREFGVIDREFHIHGVSTCMTHGILRYKSILIESKDHLKTVVSIAKVAGYKFYFKSISNPIDFIGLYLEFNDNGVVKLNVEIKKGFMEFFIPNVMSVDATYN